MIETQETGTFIASMELLQFPDGVKAWVKIADEDKELVDVPPQLAAQLPMAISMIRHAND